jgi:hypothetical protein
MAVAVGDLIMDEDKDSPRGFRVTDRRRFSEEGEEREVESQEGQVESEDRPVGHAAGPDVAPGAAGTMRETAGHEAPVNFSTFVLGLSTQALLHLGEIDDPTTGRLERDLEAAKHVIDILGLLKDKTRNNLEQAEDRLLDAVLYDLRMKYVELARRPKEGA